MKGVFVQRFCGLVAVVSPTSRNHSLDLILSVSTKTPEQGRGVTPFTSALRPPLTPMLMVWRGRRFGFVERKDDSDWVKR